MASLRNEDYTDRELLHVIDRAAVLDGYAGTEDIADVLGLSDNGHSKSARIAPRLSWMKRYGFIENVDGSDLEREVKGKLWRVTEVGRQLMSGRLAKPVENAIERGDPGAQLLIMRQLSRRADTEAVRIAVRREYQHNTARR